MSDDAEFKVVLRAPTLFDAELKAGLLKHAGIPAHVEGGTGVPNDDFTTATHLLGQGIRVFVPADRVEEALAVLAATSEEPEIEEAP